MIARILFSAWWNLLWWIKMKLVWRWQMHWLQEYYFMYVGTLCDASKRIFFLSIVCSDCKNTVFCMLEPSLINQNKFSYEVTNAVIARILFSTCWDILWCIKTNFHFMYCMQWIFFSSIACSDCKNTVFCTIVGITKNLVLY